MAKDEERPEDLNPQSGDIEERVRRMLDPRVPDEPETPKATELEPTEKSDIKIIDGADSEEAPLTAPALPGAKKPAQKGKVIIPISHHDDAPLDEVADEAPSAPTIRKITVAEHESKDEVAEKLDEAIAGLDPETSDDAEPAEEVEADVHDETETLGDVDDTIDLSDEAVIEDAGKVPEPLEATEPNAPLDEAPVLEDPETDKAIDEIIAADGDELLQAEDAAKNADVSTAKAARPKPEPASKPAAAAETIKPKKQKHKKHRLKHFFRSKGFRKFLIFAFVIGLAAAGTVPTSRYLLLNTAGIRATSSLAITDYTTQQPLKGVDVALGNVTGTTDDSGKVQFQNLRLGPTTLRISKLAFAPIERNVVIGWGSNPLGDFRLEPRGVQYSFMLTDFLSGKPIKGAEISSDNASAKSDDKGVVKLNVSTVSGDKLKISIKAGGYRDESVEIPANKREDNAFKLVPARRHAFVSKRSGSFDLYSIYIDGKDEKLVMAGSGKEHDDITLVPHPTNDLVAFVATRSGNLSSSGKILQNLLLVNVNTKDKTSVVNSEKLQVLGWSGDQLVYVQSDDNKTPNSPKRSKLVTYNSATGASKELATSNYFNDAVLADGYVYFAPSSAQAGGTAAQFYRVKADGSDQKSLFGQEVWNILRIGYDQFALAVQQQWYDYRLGGSQPTKLNTAPAEQTSRLYLNSPDGKRSLWVDQRDGKGVLLVYSISGKDDKRLVSESGLDYPVSWLNDHTVVYRIDNGSQTADYVLNLDGGKPLKIRDVTATTSLIQATY